MTSQEALLELDSNEFQNLSNELKLQRLEELSKSLSADASGSTTICYSGNINGQSASNIARELSKTDPNARIIDNTEVGRFLSYNNKFKKALAEALGTDLDEIQSGDVSSSVLSEYNSKLYNTDPSKDKLGFWSQASKRFAQETKGRVIILIGKDADPKKIFGSIEFQELMKNKSITHINNIPIDEFKKTLNVISNQAITPKQIELLSESSSQILKTLNDDYNSKTVNTTDNTSKDIETNNIYNKKSKIDIESFETQMNKIESETIRFKNMLAEAMNRDNDKIYNKEKDNNITQESIKSAKDEETNICKHRRR